MSQGPCPSDILLLIFSHLDPQSKRQLCLVSRYFHSIFAPLVLRNIRIPFCQENTSSDSIDSRLQTCSSPLPNLYEHAQALRVKAQNYYFPHHVTTSLLPALWDTIARLKSLKSLQVDWEYRGECEDHQTIEEYHRHIVEGVLRATEDHLEGLVLIVDLSSQTLPVALKQIRGLKSLRIAHDQHGWLCSKSSIFGDDGVCRCDRPWMQDIIKPLIAANPMLETLELVQGCLNRGPKPNDTLPASLKNLTSLTFSSLEIPSVPEKGGALSPLRNLRHLTVRAPYRQLKIDAFWDALGAAKPPLETLVSFQICLPLVNFLKSFSGLRSLEFQRIECCDSPEVVSTFLQHVLPRHADTLERLSIHYRHDVDSIPGLDFDPKTWAPALIQLHKLEYLGIYAPPPPLFPDHEDTLSSRLSKTYQALLDIVGDMSNLNTLQIHYPEPEFGCGTGYVNWSSWLQRVLNRVVPKLRVKGGRPMRLDLFNGTQNCVPLDDETWGYIPVTVCVPEVDSSDDED
ncbi:hypothetical protein BDN72DRAFT_848335 [Pluteus cervinus]|uniref:Uncharacterized protein n=1 Tax=Pluteus cervinus TaxID=181527 RepID=A0ACD3AAP2_9AGAR|nr:hypothetical protein BDN72DRAFT_848335 [Pluteus cervinus]